MMRESDARAICVAFISSLFIAASSASAEDWPQHLGPTRDGVYAGRAELSAKWPAEGPPVVWKKKVGEGFSAPVIAEGNLILFHRVEDQMTLDCMRAATGEKIWTTGYESSYTDDMHKGDGPRATPAVADGKVYAFGPDGVLICVDLATGKTHWQVDTRKQFKSPQGFFGRACSPVVEGGLVLLNIGGPQAGVGAFDGKTGELRWKATGDEAGYASPVCATIKDARYAFFFTRTGLVAADPKTGDVFFQHRWRSRQHASVNAAAPLVVGDIVFLSSSYETGATALAVDGKNVQTLWAGDDILSSQYANIVHKDGHLFGFDGRNDFNNTRLRCVELKTGKVNWTQAELSAGPIVLAGDKLVILLESGELLLVSADAKGYAQLAKAAVLNSPVRSGPALADGFLHARDGSQLVCFDLRKK
jgi:outer membrane protein assembly factor BamB